MCHFTHVGGTLPRFRPPVYNCSKFRAAGGLMITVNSHPPLPSKLGGAAQADHTEPDLDKMMWAAGGGAHGAYLPTSPRGPTS